MIYLSMLSTHVGGLYLENPLMNASGILGVAPSSSKVLARAGAGAVVTKSIGPYPREGNPNPSIIELSPGTFLNAVGLGNPGIEAFLEELPEIKECGVPVVVSIFGDSIEKYGEIAGRAERAGADAIELNVSCPHAEVSTIGTDPARTEEVVGAVRANTTIPLFVKLSPNVTSVVDVALAAERGGADAVVAINTLRGVHVNVDLKLPVLSHGTGGLSGRAIKPVAVGAVFQLYQHLRIPIIGCGGIFDWRDALEFFLAGARAVQVGSALSKGYEVFGQVAAGIEGYLESNSFGSLEDIVGLAVRNFVAASGGASG
ncbi:MAG: dihydroorotate dehydrogenase [Promethearchaeota archaeon]